MIIPGNFFLFFKKPEQNLAWCFLFINLVIFAYVQFGYAKWPSPALLDQVKDKNFSSSVVEMYKQTLDSSEIKALQDETSLAIALRDQRFWKRLATFPFQGDKVQIELNRKRLMRFETEYMTSSQYQLGLGRIENSPWVWVTYQFTHASFVHLLGNMIILFLLLSYLQASVSWFWLVSIYLLGGFGGGVSYLLFEGSGSMAVVGASASVYALMAFTTITKSHERMPWSYLIAPTKKAYGIIFLPVFFIFPIFIMSDFISALSEPAGLSTSNVAISAHIGGALVGFVLGLIYMFEQSVTHFLIREWQIDERKLAELD